MDTNVQALKGLYAALNGDPKDVENMDTSSEVITAMQDVAAAAATELPVVKKIDAGKTLTVNGNGKWAAIMPESIIDDTEASETKTYSSSKIVSLIPANELPTPSADNNGKVATVVSDGEGGYTWGAEIPTAPAPVKFVVTISYDSQEDEYSSDKTLNQIIEASNAGNDVWFDVPSWKANAKLSGFIKMGTNDSISDACAFLCGNTSDDMYTAVVDVSDDYVIVKELVQFG